MSTINEVTDLSLDGDIAVITLNSPPVNALSAKVRTGLFEAVQKADSLAEVKAIVIYCEGKTFIAGADITEFGKPPQGTGLAEVLGAIENSTKPVIAAIHGTALGGGLEVALACHYRVAIPSAKTGLPEINLGIIPGSGGTQRLPRIVGAAAALDMITSGKHISASKSVSIGVIDELIDGDLLSGAKAFAMKVVQENRPLKKVRDMKAEGDNNLFTEFRKQNARKFRGRRAPELAIQAIEAAVNLPFDEGLAFERKAFMELVTSTESAAMRHVFFAERVAAKVDGLEKDTPLIPIKKVGMIGAGTMGGGIAMNFANAGIPVKLIEQKAEALERGLGVIRKNYENTAKKGRISVADVETRMSLLTGSLNMEDLADCDLVIEAVFENMAVKKEVFTKLDAIVKQGAILASNTSALDVNEIASATTRPESVIGLHFFSPANIMRLLEVVRGEKSSDSVIATSMALAKTIGKVAVLVGVCPGFVGNRILRFRQMQAMAMLSEGAMPWDIDKVLYEFGFPMGAFAMSDLAGLDIGWSKETSNPKILRDALCEMDRRGQKTGAGYYDYDEKRNAIPSPVTEKLIKELVTTSGKAQREISEAEMLERCVLPMINEGAKILEEGMAQRASDIDTVWVNGYGWPVYRGGPMFYADTLGLPHVLERLKHYQAEHGDFFKPAALLEKLAKEGKSFTR